MSPELQASIITLIVHERVRQDLKWGSHRQLPPDHWLRLLITEIGEVACAINEKKDPSDELLEAAAVIVAWLEDHFHKRA